MSQTLVRNDVVWLRKQQTDESMTVLPKMAEDGIYRVEEVNPKTGNARLKHLNRTYLDGYWYDKSWLTLVKDQSDN